LVDEKKELYGIIDQLVEKKIDNSRGYIDEILEEVQDRNRGYFLGRMKFEIDQMEEAIQEGNIKRADQSPGLNIQGHRRKVF
jgi:hypothetical protein